MSSSSFFFTFHSFSLSLSLSLSLSAPFSLFLYTFNTCRMGTSSTLTENHASRSERFPKVCGFPCPCLFFIPFLSLSFCHSHSLPNPTIGISPSHTQPPFNAVKAIKGGILMKEGGGFVRPWQRRLVILDTAYLYYYHSEQDVAPRGVLSLSDCTVSEEKKISQDRKAYCFYVICKESWKVKQEKEFTNRKYVFLTDSYSEMCDWVSLISKCAKWEDVTTLERSIMEEECPFPMSHPAPPT